MTAHTDIIAKVAAQHGLRPRDITGPRTNRRIAWARQQAMHEIAEATHWSNADIGEVLHRDHSTVRHGIAAHRARLAKEAAE